MYIHTYTYIYVYGEMFGISVWQLLKIVHLVYFLVDHLLYVLECYICK